MFPNPLKQRKRQPGWLDAGELGDRAPLVGMTRAVRGEDYEGVDEDAHHGHYAGRGVLDLCHCVGVWWNPCPPSLKRGPWPHRTGWSPHGDAQYAAQDGLWCEGANEDRGKGAGDVLVIETHDDDEPADEVEEAATGTYLPRQKRQCVSAP